MVAEGVIAPTRNLGHCSVNPTFTAIVEGKPAKEVFTAAIVFLCTLRCIW